MKFLRQLIMVAVSALAFSDPSRADVTNAPPDFKEVYDLIRSHLAGETEAELDRAAVDGLLDQLHSKVWLAGNSADTNTPPEGALLSKSNVFDGRIAYLRIGRVDDGLADAVAAALKQLADTNQLKGLVVDLRFASGHDYSAAASTADLFVSKDVPLLDFGAGSIHSKAKTDALALPIVVLINRQTAAAAEALAAVLRQSADALILGAPTAGEATMGKDFALKNGQTLRIATAAVKLGNGDALSANGIKPDIQISVKPGEERAYFADPYAELPSSANLVALMSGAGGSATNSTNRVTHAARITEADLMRERKERPGLDIDDVQAPTSDSKDAGQEKRVVRDPVLARALDLIKGISLMRQSHAP